MTRVPVLTALVFLVLLAAIADAQVLPIPQGADMRQEQRRYSAEVLQEINALLQDWQAVWATGDSRGLARFYTADAALHYTDGAAIQGRGAIEGELRSLVPRARRMRAGVEDFSVSGQMAYLMGRFWHEGDANGTPPETGTYVMVAQREGRTWRIRAQLFKAADGGG